MSQRVRATENAVYRRVGVSPTDYTPPSENDVIATEGGDQVNTESGDDIITEEV